MVEQWRLSITFHMLSTPAVGMLAGLWMFGTMMHVMFIFEEKFPAEELDAVWQHHAAVRSGAYSGDFMQQNKSCYRDPNKMDRSMLFEWSLAFFKPIGKIPEKTKEGESLKSW